MLGGQFYCVVVDYSILNCDSLNKKQNVNLITNLTLHLPIVLNYQQAFAILYYFINSPNSTICFSFIQKAAQQYINNSW